MVKKKRKKHVHVRSSFLWLAALVGLSGNAIIDAALNAQTALPSSFQINFTAIDDGDGGFSTMGGTPVAHAKSYRGDFTYLLSTTTPVSATWEFKGLKTGTYHLYGTWAAFGTNNPAAAYTISNVTSDVTVTLPSLTADQRNVPNDAQYNGSGWEKIGTVTLQEGTLRVTLTGGSTFSIADGIAIQEKDPRDDIGLSTSSTSQQAAASSSRSSLPGSVTEYYCNGTWQYTPCDGQGTGGGVYVPNDGPMDGPASSLPSGGIGGNGAGTSYCGDGMIQTGETCDDGNKKAGDGCSPLCGTERCGDSVVTPSLGEECDPNTTNCSNCRWLYCGDAVVTNALGEECDDGNVRRGDGCSETCRRELASTSASSSTAPILPASSSMRSSSRSSAISLSASSIRSSTPSQQTSSQPPAGPALLMIRELDSGSQEIVLPGQKNILLKRFELETSNNASLQIPLIIFGGDMVFNYQNSSGALKGENYALYMDTNNDGVTDTLFNKRALADGPSAISFTNNRTFLPGTKTLFELRGDVLPTVGNIELSFSFLNVAQPITALNTINGGASLQGVRKNGICPVSSCSIDLTTLPSKKIRVAQQGALYVTKSATPVPAHQILAGGLSDILFRAQLRAERETVSVSRMGFFIAGNGYDSIDHLQVSVTGYTGVVGYAQKTKCSPASRDAFCVVFSPALSVLPGTPLELSVKAQIKSDEQGAVSGHEIGIALDAGLPGALEARGLLTQNMLNSSDGDSVDQGEFFLGTPTPGPHGRVSGTMHGIVLQKFSRVENASGVADNTTVPSGVASIGEFRFSTGYNGNTKNGANKATITDLIFTVNLANIEMNPNGFRLYNRADPSTKTPCSVLDYTDGAATFHVACWDIANSPMNSTLPPSSSSVFALEGDITDPDTAFFGRSTLQVSLDSFTNATLQGASKDASHIRWLDTDTGTSQEFWWIEHADPVVRSTAYSN